MHLVEDLIKDLPRVSPWEVHEHIWAIFTAIALEAEFGHGGAHKSCVRHVIFHYLHHTWHILQSSEAPCHCHIGCAVKDSSHDTAPVLVHRCAVCEFDVLGAHCPSTAHTSESSKLGERVCLDCHLSCTINFVDCARTIGI